MLKTLEGNPIIPGDSPIRFAIKKEELCKACMHLGDLCFIRERTHEALLISDVWFRLVVACNGLTPIPSELLTTVAGDTKMPDKENMQLQKSHPEYVESLLSHTTASDAHVPSEVVSNSQAALKINHAEMVAALAKSGEAILVTLTPMCCHLLHMSIGMATEYTELLGYDGLENLQEELGDFEFYFEGARQAFGYTYEQTSVLPEQIPVHHSDRFSPLGIAMGDLVDVISKKIVIYRKDVDPSLALEHMRRVDFCLGVIRDIYGYSRQDILDANISKLGERYMGFKYSDQAAIARADKTTAA